ncbi:MAG: histidine kinase [Saprospiraceae bacterium]|nr:histidine kinase [Saprospiraceae bacterium]
MNATRCTCPALFALLFLWGVVPTAKSQPGFISLGHLTTEQGLSQDFVGAIAQDDEGFIWFGTHDGLTRYDGRRCTVFRAQANDSTSIPDNRVTGLTSDGRGRLWVTTMKGICYYLPATKRFRRVPIPSPTAPNKTQEHYFSNISFDKDGTGWTHTDSFLVRLDGHTFRAEFFRIPCRTKSESQVFVDSKGRVWVTIVGQHLLRFDPITRLFTYVRGLDKPDGPNPWPMWIQEDSGGKIWHSDWDQAFFTYDEQQQRFVNLPDSAGIATVFVLEERPHAPPLIWAGGGNHGLWRLNCADMRRTEFPKNPRDPYSHNNTRTYSLYRDPKTGIIWIGTELGVEYYDPNGIKFGRVLLPEKPGQSQFYSITGMMPDPSVHDRYWVSVWGVGLFEWNRSDNTFNLFEYNNRGVFSNEIFDMARDAEGNLWYATWKGVERFDPRTRQRRHFMQPAPWNTNEDKALSIEIGPDGRVWHGNNRGGLVETDPSTGKSRNIFLYQHDGSKFPFYTLWDIKLDNRGRVLVSSPNGLLRYDPATEKNEHLLYRSPPLNVLDAVCGPDKRLYVGTAEGLYVLDERDSLLVVMTVEHGLRNQNVRKLEMDQQGNIWLATANGLHRYEPATERIHYFSKADGLFVNDHSQGFRVMPNGELFLGGEYSFNIASPENLFGNIHPPRLALNNILIPDRKTPWTPSQPLTLRPGEAVVTFDIAAIHFTQPDKTVLAYRLEGFNEQWTETQQNTITYTNLDGGRYKLQVRARNGDGVWSEETLEIPFRVVPPFYKTWWFRTLLALLLAGIIAGVSLYRRQVRLRMEAMKARSDELEKQKLLNEIALLKTQVNPHFLFNSLSILSSLVHTNADLSEQFIDQLSRSYRYILEQKDQSLVTMRTELAFIRSYTFLLKIRFENKFDLQILLEDTSLDQYKIAPLTLQLLVENAVKHNRMSAKEPLIVEVAAEGETLIVRNALQLRPNPEASTGTGLKNIISRYALLTDRPVEAGTTADGYFVVKVPLLREN